MELNKPMRERGITTKQLSDITGIPTATISAYRQNQRNPKARNALLIAEALGVSYNDIREFLIPCD